MVVKNGHEELVQMVQVKQHSRDTQEDLDSDPPWKEIRLLCCDLDIVSRLIFSTS